MGKMVEVFFFFFFYNLWLGSTIFFDWFYFGLGKKSSYYHCFVSVFLYSALAFQNYPNPLYDS